MREIKFRAWAFASQKMFYPDSDNGWNIENGNLYPLPNTELEQYTGLKDKNGREIYEGDIVEVASHNEEWGDSEDTHEEHYDEHNEEVVFDNGAFCLKGNRTLSDSIDEWSQIEAPFYTLCEVIGNIHENPELLI